MGAGANVASVTTDEAGRFRFEVEEPDSALYFAAMRYGGSMYIGPPAMAGVQRVDDYILMADPSAEAGAVASALSREPGMGGGIMGTAAQAPRPAAGGQGGMDIALAAVGLLALVAAGLFITTAPRYRRRRTRDTLLEVATLENRLAEGPDPEERAELERRRDQLRAASRRPPDMPLVTLDAIVLQAFPYSETSKILRLLTPSHGVQSVIAKGARRPRSRYGGILEPFTDGMASFYYPGQPGPPQPQRLRAGPAPPAAGPGPGPVRRRVAPGRDPLAHRQRAGGAGGLLQRSAPPWTGSRAPPARPWRPPSLAETWALVTTLGFGPSLDRCVAATRSWCRTATSSWTTPRAACLCCGQCGGGVGGGRTLPGQARADLRALAAGTPWRWAPRRPTGSSWPGSWPTTWWTPSLRSLDFLAEATEDAMIRGIVGTGGHIDHGKTALVEALTGIRTDRLPEEQRRGITIDLGFAHLELDDGVAGVVDVPGHEDFIRNMVAGASGFDLFLLVVAADEGVMPQTREHVAIAELLGVPAAVVALTKTDLVDPEWLELAADDVATFLADTRFADAPIIPTSAVTGAGWTSCGRPIQAGLPAPRGRPDDLFRLPVDRVFTVHGTGHRGHRHGLERWTPARTSTSASSRAMRTARVRALQVHGSDVDRVQAGQRAAIALAGVDRDEVGRGATLVVDAGGRPPGS
jgi:small GTP-binding protein